ncbi:MULTISPECIES: CPBP family intramembrane glutamic endopeptidase [unclassified Arthrobacter]|uniref:CPBP family intramembrane glutamic endopeptidase n=1 Tax=unclassified Arthrobacter TaxID=235627 RepID=UPI002106D82D|nr:MULTISPECIES: type II CAAX endopeptidase family protein [unclassified Arthrobacter]MCQ1947936.1 CPBP family intramembrane metalloprotease [Arthrobacter sp. zg-Y1116]MCQ1987875.1 CPBP family intramembrane metalloprotease [Arthrobacter sp. zg-Y844]MCQ1996159.1 CPBP family intramembrane metalloprotease [Arthrobacter sp. zg-Y1171]UWX82783.1 CPBP family intramembrane metalloprotease [Arthrobacter sp. zg-Y1171]
MRAAFPSAPAESLDPRARRMLVFEILIVLGLSLGRSGVYAVVELIEKATQAPLGDQTTTLNPVLDDRPYFDLVYQLLGIFFSLLPVALVLFLLTEPGKSAFRRIGFTFARPLRDFALGVALAAVIGIGTLGVYAAGRALGITTAIVPAALDTYWWTLPVLILSAMRHAVLEEVIVVGYLFLRLRQLGWGTPAIILTSALIRASYHLYQGIGPGIGNFLMGLLFGYVYTRTRRVMPLVIAHALVDIAGFVGFALFGSAIGIGD